jgi:hypothetical protein
MRRYTDRDVILCGDLNFHLDGRIEDWPEIEMLTKYKTLGFIDTYRALNPDEGGFTEDTDRNPMRWNQKLIEKHYRYDGIFYKSVSSVPHSSALIGTEFECIDTVESKWFIEKISEVVPDELDRLIQCPPDKDHKIRLPINPSDHFGVLTAFGAKEKAGGKRKQRKTRRKKKSIRK